MAKMPVSVANTHPETPTATILMKKPSDNKVDQSFASTLTPKKPIPVTGKPNVPKPNTAQAATIVMKNDSADKTQIIIAKPKQPSDEEVPTKFVPLGAIITAGDEINFHRPPPTPRKPKPNMKPSQTPTGKFMKKDIERADNEKAQAARMKELRLLSLGKKLLDSCKSGNATEVRQLMTEGAPFIADWVGTSPLHYSVMNKHVEVTELLLKAGICKDAKNKVDRTPLHVAAHMGLAYMVKLLLSYGADVNCRDMLNMTPLHWAAESGDVLTAKILLDYGADTSVVNKFGKTAINFADQNNYPEIVKAILETNNLHPDTRMIKVSHLKLKILSTSKGINPVAEILEPSPSAIQQFTTTKMKKVVLVAKENPEGGAYRGTLQIGSDIDSDNDSDPSTNMAGEMSADSALKLLKSHGVRMVEPDKDTVISSAVLNGHTIRLTDAGKLAFKSLEKTLKIDKLTSSDRAPSPETDSSKNDRTSPNSEGPPAKAARLSTGQTMHKVSAEQLIGMKNEKKIVIKGASLSQTTSLPECTIAISEPNTNGANDSALSGMKIDDSLNNKNAVYLQRMENKANFCLRQISALKRQLKIKEEEHASIKKQIEMFKACSKLSYKFNK